MSRNLEIKIVSRSTNGVESFEGTVSIPGTKPTKLVRSTDGQTTYANRSSLLNSARNLAKKLGFEGIEEASKKAAPAKQAAKRSTTPRARRNSTSTTAETPSQQS